MNFKVAALMTALVLMPAFAQADTLYSAGPPPVGPGHPLRLGPDHRAGQIGDLVYVVYDFSVTTASTNVATVSKDGSIGFNGGTGNLALGFLRIPTAIGGNTAANDSRTHTGSNSFVSAMMAQVTNVLPSGVLQIEGDQGLTVNGSVQKLHIVGYIRPEDVDGSDEVLSSHVANVQATFSGDFQEGHKGLVRKILDFLF